MPKLVDHDERRLEIAHATWAAVSDVGIERLRLRDIAAEVGCTTGVFAHYFRDKDSVLRYSFDLAYERVRHTITLSNSDVTSPLVCLENALVALIPEKRRPDSVAFVAMCFGIRNSDDRILEKTFKKNRDDYRKQLKKFIHAAIDANELPNHHATNDVLDLVLAVLDGVCLAALLNPNGYPKSRGERVVRTLIEQIAKRKH